MSLNRTQITAMRKLLRMGSTQRMEKILDRLEPTDLVFLLENVGPSEHRALMELFMVPNRAKRILRMLPDTLLGDHMNRMEAHRLAGAANAMSLDLGVRILRLLPEAKVLAVIELLPPDRRSAFSKLMSFPRGSAGMLMSTEYLAVPDGITAQQAIDLAREQAGGKKSVSYIYTLDPEGRLTGVVPFFRLVLAPSDEPIESLLERDPFSVTVFDDQEKAAASAIRHGLLAIPVVDEQRRLVGIVTLDSALDVVQAEAVEDLYLLKGLSREDHLFSSMGHSLRRRTPWMTANLLTAFVAASVVGLFEGSISKLAVLAVFMPVVAGMGGNLGTQVLTVVTRGIALGEDHVASMLKVVFKQVVIGILIGAFMGILTAFVAFLWKGKPVLGLVLFMAMVINLGVAGLMGAVIPLILRSAGLDPALGSGVLVTTCTDVVGFLSFLGLATLMMSFMV